MASGSGILNEKLCATSDPDVAGRTVIQLAPWGDPPIDPRTRSARAKGARTMRG